MMLANLTTLTAAIIGLAGAATAQSFNIIAQYNQDGKSIQARTWYGDGKIYIGPTVPPSLKVATNFTVPNIRTELLYITPDSASSQDGSAPAIPDPTFLVANDRAGAADALSLRHDARGLTDDDIVFWTRYEYVLLAIDKSSTLASRYYLRPVEGVEGTYVVTWKSKTAPKGRRMSGAERREAESATAAAAAAAGDIGATLLAQFA